MQKYPKRLQIPVDPETQDMLQLYANAAGRSLPAVCGEILAQTAPVMVDMASALEQAKTAPAAAMRIANTALKKQLAAVNETQLDLSLKATGKKRQG